MQVQDGFEISLPSCPHPQDSASSLCSIRASIHSSIERYPAATSFHDPGLQTNAEKIISDYQSLLDVLYKAEIPGPKLIRLQREFRTPLGHGGQANIYGTSADFEKGALALQGEDVDSRIKCSALHWTRSVVKHLRTDQRRNDVEHAHREISQLCHPALRCHPNIVKLISWGLSLDALESVSSDSLSTPLLILERAYCDMTQFIKSEEYDNVPYETLCHICLDVGQGLSAVHSAGMIHGDLKLENILIFPNEKSPEIHWTAKLCDFGSAISTDSNSPGVTRYLGSDTWRPPECYEKHLIGTPMPEPLIPCDTFAYGLVVWATFVGILAPRSLIRKNMKVMVLISFAILGVNASTQEP